MLLSFGLLAFYNPAAPHPFDVIIFQNIDIVKIAVKQVFGTCPGLFCTCSDFLRKCSGLFRACSGFLEHDRDFTEHGEILQNMAGVYKTRAAIF